MTGILHGTCKCCEESVCCGTQGCEIDLANISLTFNATMYKAAYQWMCEDRQCMHDAPPRCGECSGTFPWDASDSDTVGSWDSDEASCTHPQTLATVSYPPVCFLKTGHDFACDDARDSGCPAEDLGVTGPRCVVVIKEDFSVTFDWDSQWYHQEGILYGFQNALYNTYVDNDNAGEGGLICSATEDDKEQCCNDFVTTCSCPMQVEINCATGEVVLTCQGAVSCDSASDCYSECGPYPGGSCCMSIANTVVCCSACQSGWLGFDAEETWPSVSTDCPERFDSQTGGTKKRYGYRDGFYGGPAGCFVIANFRRIVGNFSMKGTVNEDCD